MSEQDKETIADLYYIEGYAKFLAAEIHAGHKPTYGYAMQMAELANKVKKRINDVPDSARIIH